MFTISSPHVYTHTTHKIFKAYTEGIALENSDGTNSTQCGQNKCGKVLVFISIGEGNIAQKINLLEKENAALKTQNTAILSRIA